MRRALLGVLVLVFVLLGVWWATRAGSTPAGQTSPVSPTSAPSAPRPFDGVPAAPPAPPTQTVAQLPAAQVPAALRAACAKIDDACQAVPLWSPLDFEPAPRVRLVREGAGARIKVPAADGRSPWARCVDRTLAGVGLSDLQLPADEVEAACPPLAHPRADFFWHDREPFEETLARCWRGRGEPMAVDATLDLVVLGDVLEVQNVEVKGERDLDPGTQRCLEQELASTRVRFSPEQRPGFDRFSWKFKSTGGGPVKGHEADEASRYTLARGSVSPRSPAASELEALATAVKEFPENPYAQARLGEAWARRYRATGDAQASSQARQAYERYLALAQPEDPLVPVIRAVLDER